MEFETLKKDNRKKWVIGIVAVVAIASTVFFVSTRANYKTTQRLNLINTTINWDPTDLEIVSIKIKNGNTYTDIDEVPTSGYTLSNESYCEVNGNPDSSIPMEYKDGKIYIQVGNKGTKCYLVFEEADNITIIANANGSSVFPTKDSKYVPSSISCTNGTAKFDLVNWKVKVDSANKTTCTVNFEPNKNQVFATYLKNKECSSSVTDEAGAKDCLVKQNGYRYEGSDPNNYVLFNDELWRIIGVFDVKPEGSSTTESLVKLIRDETLDAFAWNTSASNTWSESSLKAILNSGYLNGVDGECSTTSAVKKTCKFSQSGIKVGARSKIQTVAWNIGASAVGKETSMYATETSATWTGSIGLMSASDYGYAAYIGEKSDGLPDLSNVGNSWLYKGGYQWTITPNSSDGESAIRVSTTSDFTELVNKCGLDSWNVTSAFGVRPSIYLKSSVKIIGGQGTYEIPYVIE